MVSQAAREYEHRARPDTPPPSTDELEELRLRSLRDRGKVEEFLQPGEELLAVIEPIGLPPGSPKPPPDLVKLQPKTRLGKLMGRVLEVADRPVDAVLRAGEIATTPLRPLATLENKATDKLIAPITAWQRQFPGYRPLQPTPWGSAAGDLLIALRRSTMTGLRDLAVHLVFGESVHLAITDRRVFFVDATTKNHALLREYPRRDVASAWPVLAQSEHRGYGICELFFTDGSSAGIQHAAGRYSAWLIPSLLNDPQAPPTVVTIGEPASDG